MGITCKKATDFISKKEEGKITWYQTIQLWQHLFICSLCKRFYKQNKIITTALSHKDPVKEAMLTADEKAAFIQKLEEDKATKS